jgi:hypothetical protein
LRASCAQRRSKYDALREASFVVKGVAASLAHGE